MSPFSHHHRQKVIYVYNCCSSTVVSMLLPPLFPPLILNPTCLWLCPCLLYMFLDNPVLSFPCYPTPLSPLVIRSLFFISMSLVLFCLLVCFVDYIPLIGEIIWYLPFTTWLISLSITLSSSIHAVTKGRSSFFPSAA